MSRPQGALEERLEAKTLLILVWSLHAGLLGFVGLEAIGLPILPGRQIFGFIALTFLPGILALRALSRSKIRLGTAIVFSVALSIATLMFLGFALTVSFGFLGASAPISELPILVALTGELIVLSAVVWRRRTREKPTSEGHHEGWLRTLLSPPVLFLLHLPILAVLGVFLFNSSQDNSLLLLLLFLVVIVPLSVGTGRFIPRRLFPFAVFVVALSLLWHRSLITGYLTGWDIHIEYYFQSLVLEGGQWNPSLPSSVNAMLSSVVLAPIYSIVLDVELVWVLKIVYPFVFAFVPVVLYEAFRTQVRDNLAFLAVFFFMATFVFFTEMLHLPRQQIGELFFAASLLAFVMPSSDSRLRTALLIVFSLSIVVSHYALSYIYAVFLVGSIVLLRRGVLSKAFRQVRDFVGPKGKDSTPDSAASGERIETRTLSPAFVGIFVVSSLSWYIFTSQAAPFISVVQFGNHVVGSLSEILVPESRSSAVLLALGLAAPEVGSIQRQVYVMLQYLTQFFIVLGVAVVLGNRRKLGLSPVVVSMTVMGAMLLLASIVLPFFSKGLTISRIYHISLVLLALAFVLGARTSFRWLSDKILRPLGLRGSPRRTAPLLLVILVPYFLLSTGAISQVTGDAPLSVSLDPGLDYPRFTVSEVTGARWLDARVDDGAALYADRYGWLLMSGYRYGAVGLFWGSTTFIATNGIVFTRCVNSVGGQVPDSETSPNQYVDFRSSDFSTRVLSMMSLLYDNSCAKAYG